ncbi:MAG: NUDIX hydrolase [Desulfomonilaceae bacterium]
MYQKLMHFTDDEVLEVVDADDVVMGLASRREIHQQKLMHRAVHMFVFNSAGSLFVQRRSSQKDTHPLKLDSSAAGHVDPGEDYVEAAARELYEELSLRADLQEILRLPPTAETGYEHVVLYATCTDDTPIVDPDEIIEGSFMTPEELSEKMTQNADDFVPAFVRLWESYRGRRA